MGENTASISSRGGRYCLPKARNEDQLLSQARGRRVLGESHRRSLYSLAIDYCLEESVYSLQGRVNDHFIRQTTKLQDNTTAIF
jgi:hypothetical protein